MWHNSQQKFGITGELIQQRASHHSPSSGNIDSESCHQGTA